MGFALQTIRWAIRLALAVALLVAVLVVVEGYVSPVSTLMLARWATGRPVERVIVRLDQVSPNLVLAVVASEDGRFCLHHGVDWDALKEVMDDEDGPSRGASTLTMQVAKNLYLWPGRSVVRKALEIPLALFIDAAWPKRRVMEVYLAIAEWGDGVFGAEAAARHAFGVSAAALNPRQAALLATALPNPILRDPAHPTRRQRLLASIVEGRMRDQRPPTDCLGVASGR